MGNDAKNTRKSIDPKTRLAIAQWPDDAPPGQYHLVLPGPGHIPPIIPPDTTIDDRTGTGCSHPAGQQKAEIKPHADRRRDRGAGARNQTRAGGGRPGLRARQRAAPDDSNGRGEGAPSVSTLARIFRREGVARSQPSKRPRSSWRRFVYPAPNACWQIDGTNYTLAGGRPCVILQIIDDHSRLAIASLASRSENARDTVRVVKKGIRLHGVPQRLLSDNGAAFNTTRRGKTKGLLVAYLEPLGVEPITGKPYHPQTQGKNERFHQPLFRWLDKQPLAKTLKELQSQIDQFDEYYNTQRPHQGLPGRITPMQAWQATPKATPPRPKPPENTPDTPTLDTESPDPARHTQDGLRATKVRNNGIVRVSKIEYNLGAERAGQTVFVLKGDDDIEFFDANGTSIARTPIPPAGTTYVGIHQLSPKS